MHLRLLELPIDLLAADPVEVDVPDLVLAGRDRTGELDPEEVVLHEGLLDVVVVLHHLDGALVIVQDGFDVCLMVILIIFW